MHDNNKRYEYWPPNENGSLIFVEAENVACIPKSEKKK